MEEFFNQYALETILAGFIPLAFLAGILIHKVISKDGLQREKNDRNLVNAKIKKVSQENLTLSDTIHTERAKEKKERSDIIRKASKVENTAEELEQFMKRKNRQ